MDSSKFELSPIGIIHTHMQLKFEAPHQPEDGCSENNVIELFPGQNYEQALQDLSGFNRIWLIWAFHLNSSWRPRVLPPRGPAIRRGVFATRSPHRPNPIGMTAVPLLGIDGLKLYIGNCDLVDGTPILDIKPYISSIDSFPDSSKGWLDEVEAYMAEPPAFSVSTAEKATQQIEWLRSNWNIDFTERAFEILSRDPSPHRTRRIARNKRGRLRLGCGAWRLFFSVAGTSVLVEELSPGYPMRLLQKVGFERVPDHEAQIAFAEKWSGIEAFADDI